MSVNLGGFEREADIELRKQKRQEEWEKVRTADQPELAPEEAAYDGRSLYDRLKEQKDAKDLEFEESRKFKNMIRGLDDDDVDHLEFIDNRKNEEERKKHEEEQKELSDYRAKVAELQEQSADQKLAQLVTNKAKTVAYSRGTSQKSILCSAVKRKSQGASQEPPEKVVKVIQPSALKCIAVLPGIGHYKSSDSDASSDEVSTDEITNDKIDLTGRVLRKKKECNDD